MACCPYKKLKRTLAISAVLWLLLLVAAPVFKTLGANEIIASSLPPIEAIQSGETLVYDVSWSNIVAAGTVVMEVQDDKLPDGKDVFKFVVIGRSSGVVGKFFKVYDAVQSIFDPRDMQSLAYNIEENYGKKKKRRALIFDHAHKTVVSRVNDDPPETLVVPEHVQDALSSFYYLRAVENYKTDKTIVFDVYDSGKIWTVEVYTMGREIVKTPAGEFSTVKIRTYPKYQGVFMNKGEVFIWLTDDSRKVPVLMKSKLTVGSFVFTLREMQRRGKPP
jgi:hypothetical protein